MKMIRNSQQVDAGKDILKDAYAYLATNNYFLLFEHIVMYYTFVYIWLNQIAYF